MAAQMLLATIAIVNITNRSRRNNPLSVKVLVIFYEKTFFVDQCLCT